MDPLSVLSLVCNVFDLVERGYKTGKIIKNIHEDANGQQDNHVRIELHVADMEQIRDELVNSGEKIAQTDLDRRLEKVLERSHVATKALRIILEDCKARKPGSLRHSTKAAFKSIFKASSIQAQLEKLKECRDTLQMILVTNTRCVFQLSEG